MSFSQKLVIILAAASAGALGLTSAAFAGQGGAAGSAAFSVDADRNVTGVAVAAAVGKQDAFAAAFNDADGNNNVAISLGSAGNITATNYDADAFDVVAASGAILTSSADPQLTVSQANDLNSLATVNIGTGSGDAVVKFDTPIVGP